MSVSMNDVRGAEFDPDVPVLGLYDGEGFGAADAEAAYRQEDNRSVIPVTEV